MGGSEGGGAWRFGGPEGGGLGRARGAGKWRSKGGRRGEGAMCYSGQCYSGQMLLRPNAA